MSSFDIPVVGTGGSAFTRILPGIGESKHKEKTEYYKDAFVFSYLVE